MDIQKILQLIPNSVSGDGKPFVAALKNYLSKYGAVTDEKIDDALEELTKKPAHVTNITLLELHAITDGVRSNNIQVSWDITPVEDYAKAEVWYKTDGDWQKAGEVSGTQYVLQGAETGKTYYIRVVAVNAKGNAADFDTAPQASIKIKGSQYIPAPPTQFVLTWDEQGPLWKWLFTDNNYIDFFELRLDQNPGVWNDKRLDSTREAYSRANPDVRAGTAYLYIRNIFGEYSEPAVHQFNKGQPDKPSAPLLTNTLDGVRIKMNPLPLGSTKYRLYIKTVDGEEANEDYFETVNSEYIFFFFSGTITVRYQFVDPLGSGEWSDEVTANVKDLIINSDNIAAGAITNDKIAANAVTAAKIAANSITGDKIAANAITADNIAAGAINAKHLAAGSVGADAIQAGSIIGDKIAANTITGSKLAAANIDLLGALAITGGNVKLSEDGLKLTGGDGSYTLFDSEGINYVDKNGVQYAQVKKMIIGKAYDGQYIKFAAPWAKTPSILLCPMSIQVNDINYSTANLYLVCEATNISVNGFQINNYLKLAGGAYNVNNITASASPSIYTVEKMEQYWYGSYRYSYTFNAYSDVMTVTIPQTATYIEFSLQLVINNPFSTASYDNDTGTSNVYNSYVRTNYPNANSGNTRLDNSSRNIIIQLIVSGKVLRETKFTIGDSKEQVIKNFILTGNFSSGATQAVIRVRWEYKLTTNEHGPWTTLYNGRAYIARATCKCTLTRTYLKYSASDSKIARGYAMFLVTDGSTNIYTAETTVRVLINYAGSALVSKSLLVNNVSYTTNASGYISLRGSGSKVYSFTYGNAPVVNATVIFTDGTVTKVNIDAANITCYIRVKYDDAIAANASVKINGNSKTTDSSGKVAINGLDKSSGSYTVSYKNDTATITVNYTANGITTVELYSLHDGSKSWGWNETDNKKISFTAPNGAHRIKVEAEVDYAEGDSYYETSATITNTANEIVWGSGYSYANEMGENEEHRDMSEVVAVTPGKTYSLLFDCYATKGVTFSWGRAIDKMAATVTDT